MITVLMGKSGTGKDIISNELIKNHGYKKIITYTTRPMRDREVQDVTYHFITDDEFTRKVNDNFFAEYKTYNSTSGEWRYGTSLESLKEAERSDEKYLIILTPQGIADITLNGINLNVVYITNSGVTSFERLSKRGDDKSEIDRRIEADNEDFRYAYILADVTVRNDRTIKEVVNDIIERLGELND